MPISKCFVRFLKVFSDGALFLWCCLQHGASLSWIWVPLNTLQFWNGDFFIVREAIQKQSLVHCVTPSTSSPCETCSKFHSVGAVPQNLLWLLRPIPYTACDSGMPPYMWFIVRLWKSQFKTRFRLRWQWGGTVWIFHISIQEINSSDGRAGRLESSLTWLKSSEIPKKKKKEWIMSHTVSVSTQILHQVSDEIFNTWSQA